MANFFRGLTGDAHSQVADNYFVEKDTDKRIRTYPPVVNSTFLCVCPEPVLAVNGF
eukprot:COSAG06_NODE_264_length_18850_cov_2499.951848_4_plen_56_part_00